MSFERKKYFVIAFYLNIALITNLVSTLLTYGFSTNLQSRAVVAALFLSIPLSVFCFKIFFTKRILKGLTYVFFGWTFLIFMSVFIKRPPELLLRQALIDGFTHIVLPVALILEATNIERLLISLAKYIYLAAFYSCLQFFVPLLTAGAYYGFSYTTLFPGLLALALSIQGQRKYQFLFLLIFISQFLFGTRSILLCYGIESMLLLFFNRKYKKSLAVIFTVLVSVVLIIFFTEKIVDALAYFVPNARLTKFLTGEYFDNSRSLMWNYLTNEFLKNPFAVRGVLSDRVAINDFWGYTGFNEDLLMGWYAHNFIVEIIYQFGLLGVIILLYFFKTILITMNAIDIKANDTEIAIFSSVLALFFGKLLVSSSYLIDINTGILLGFLLLENGYGRKSEAG